MSDFLGKDLKLDENMDLIFTPDGDFETVEGVDCVAQDLKIALYESTIYDFLNDENSNTDSLKNFIEDILFDDPRIDYESVEIYVEEVKNGIEKDYKVDISFKVITEDNEQNLVFNLSEYIDREKLYG
ncbi:MAG: hypothetical protein JXB50_12315 [Spirochaetes bacterium]|nr:hypothetical protein [Spirochaetota bacterium]